MFTLIVCLVIIPMIGVGIGGMMGEIYNDYACRRVPKPKIISRLASFAYHDKTIHTIDVSGLSRRDAAEVIAMARMERSLTPEELFDDTELAFRQLEEDVYNRNHSKDFAQERQYLKSP